MLYDIFRGLTDGLPGGQEAADEQHVQILFKKIIALKVRCFFLMGGGTTTQTKREKPLRIVRRRDKSWTTQQAKMDRTSGLNNKSNQGVFLRLLVKFSPPTWSANELNPPNIFCMTRQCLHHMILRHDMMLHYCHDLTWYYLGLFSWEVKLAKLVTMSDEISDDSWRN